MQKIIAFLFAATIAQADTAGDFDYYILSLSWTPNFCELEGDAKNYAQCRETGLGFSLHGLWPQYENGYPENCRTRERDPSRSLTASMEDIMGSSGLAFYEWKKHGRCTGLSAEAYFKASREAFDSVNRPEILRKVSKPLQLSASVIEEAFLEANPNLSNDGITITCRDNYIQEVRVCLDKALNPRDCAEDSVRDCSLKNAVFEPIR